MSVLRLRPHRRALALLILAAACWGLGTVISKRAVEEIPAVTLLAVQLASSLLALTVAMRIRGIALTGHGTPVALARLGILNPGLAYALSLLGLAGITASLSVLLWAAEPVLILLLAAVVLKERVGPRFIALSGVAVLGMLLVLYEPGSGGSLIGIGLTLGGVACCAVYTVVTRRTLETAPSTGTLPVVLVQQAYALSFAVVLATVAVILGHPAVPVGASAMGWGSAVVSGIVYYAAAYGAYLAALRRLPASQAAASFYLIPVFGVAGGIMLLGETLSAVQWAGAILVLVAVARLLAAPARGRVPAPA